MESQRLTDTGSLSAPFGGNKQQPPKTVWLALGLFLAGSLLIIIGVSLYFTDPGAHGMALFILGAIVFIPGAYFTWIAYCAWKGYRGYTYNDIPDY